MVGHDDAKLALRLAAVDPLVGGVLLRGQKGSAKTTLARGLADLLGGAPFVELPLGATEDRLVGTLDARAALAGGEIRFQPGLLAAAHGGVLYVDEVNLLADHLVDVLLDVAVSGENRVERDGVSHRHPARFVLVGSMNPEEGELRPQLLDRFGLCVTVVAPTDLARRHEAVSRRLAFDRAPTVPVASSPAGERALRDVVPATVGPEVVDAANRLAVEVGAEGLRADLALCRAAAALAGWEGRDAATVDDVRRVAPLVLAHRSRRGPFDPPVLPPDALADAVRRALDGARDEPGDPEGHGDDPPDRRPPGQPGEEGRGSAGADGPGERNGPEGDRAGGDPGDGPAGPPTAGGDGAGNHPVDDTPDGDADRGNQGDGSGTSPASGSAEPGIRAGRPAGERALVIGPARSPLDAERRRPAPARRGRAVGDVPAGPGDPIAVLPTARRLVAAGGRGGAGAVGDELRTAVRHAPPRRTVVLCVDLSGSMGARERAEAASGTVLGLLSGAYERRDRVALVTFRGEGAQVVLSPTASVEVARHRLDGLVTGGATPLAAGLLAALEVARRARGPESEVLLAVLTDGRATGAPDALARALDAAAAVRRSGVAGLVLDCETGRSRLGLAGRLAEAMGARHVHVEVGAPGALATALGG
ncbi:MAG: AAA family ATPase [Acidimicrobiia bacterium]